MSGISTLSPVGKTALFPTNGLPPEVTETTMEVA